MSEELKPCPFCGGEAVLLPRTCERHSRYREHDRAFPIARCGNCFTQVSGPDWGDVTAAAKLWNARADRPERELLADLLEWIDRTSLHGTDAVALMKRIREWQERNNAN